MLKALAIATALSAVLAAGAAEACRIRQPIRFGLIQSATAVVMGEVRDYRRIPEPGLMAYAREQLGRDDLSAPQRASYERLAEFASVEARFTLDVLEVASGQIAGPVEVVWRPQGGGLPETFEGPHVVVLTDRPLFTLEEEGPLPLHVAEQACGASAIFEADSYMARVVQSIARGETMGGPGDTIGF